MSETVRYRFLEKLNTDGSYAGALGLAYDGYEESFEGDISASFLYGRLEHSYSLKNELSSLNEEDILPQFKDLNCRWGEIRQIQISDIDNNWTIDNLLTERWINDDKIKFSRKIA